LYDPINNSQKPGYGAVLEDNDDNPSSSDLIIPSQEFIICQQPWSVYNCIRLALSAIQLVIIIYLNLTEDEEVDKEVEGDYEDMIYMYYTRIAFWVRKKC
jgi:hypothetical protein